MSDTDKPTDTADLHAMAIDAVRATAAAGHGHDKIRAIARLRDVDGRAHSLRDCTAAVEWALDHPALTGQPTVKLTVTLHREVVDALHQMADDACCSITEQMRRLISAGSTVRDLTAGRPVAMPRADGDDPVEAVAVRLQWLCSRGQPRVGLCAPWADLNEASRDYWRREARELLADASRGSW